jgi:hypothetical protein
MAKLRDLLGLLPGLHDRAPADDTASELGSKWGQSDPSRLEIGGSSEGSFKRPTGSKPISFLQPDEPIKLVRASERTPELVSEVGAAAREALDLAIREGRSFGVIVGDPEGVQLTGLLTLHEIDLVWAASHEAVGADIQKGRRK